MSTSPAVSNPELRKVVSLLRETIQSRQQADLVARELKNARDTATQQLDALANLDREFGESFSEIVSMHQDHHEELRRESINIGQFVEPAKAWLNEYGGWVAHHKQNLAWIDNPPKGIS